MSNNESILLSLDELSMAVVLAGEPVVAGGMMMASLGNIDKCEMRGRLAAAGDSLLAKGLVKQSGDGKEITLTDGLADIAVVFTRPEFSLRLDSVRGDEMAITTYQFGQGKIVEHKSEGFLVHSLRRVQGSEEMVNGCMSFFGFGGFQGFTVPENDIPYSVLDEAWVLVDKDPAALDGYFQESGMESHVSAILANDFRESVSRGGIGRVDYGDESVIMDRGFLFLEGPERIWIFQIFAKEGEVWLKIIPGTESSFRDETEKLLKD